MTSNNDETTLTMTPGERMNQAVGFVPKLRRILTARGWTYEPKDANNTTDEKIEAAIDELHKELPTSLPRDYLALAEEGLTGLAWCRDPMYLYPPQGILNEIRRLRESYSGEYKANVELDWKQANAFVPFGSSASAFYLGWIITDPTDSSMWPIVQLDGEMSLARNRREDCLIPLAELLYRHVVRAVTPGVWNESAGSAATYFWSTESESEDIERGFTRYARDGSQDVSKSTAESIVVLGRVVMGIDESDDEDEEDEDEEEEQEEDGDRNKQEASLNRANLNLGSLFDNGTTEDDYNALGTYGILHPLDQEEDEEEEEGQQPLLKSATSIDIVTTKSAQQAPLTATTIGPTSAGTLMIPSERMDKAVGLVPKLRRILTARGWTHEPKDANNTTDEKIEAAIDELHEELPTSLPRDYLALARGGLTALEWCMDPMYLDPPQGILNEIRQLRESYSGEYKANVELDWKQANAFVPFGSSASAFYLGWIITDPTDSSMWPIVQLDGEMSLSRNQDPDCLIPLAELLYRHVVRAVTPGVWKEGAGSAATYFWSTESESEDVKRGITRYARDGSQDVSKSTAESIVVLGRVVMGNGESNDEDEEQQQDDSCDEQEAVLKRTKLNPGSLFDNGTTEDDYNALGTYGILHPLDQEEEEKQSLLNSATTLDIITTKSSQSTPLARMTKSISADMPAELYKRIQEAQAWKAMMSVSDVGPIIVTSDGKDVYAPRSLLPPSHFGLDVADNDPFESRLGKIGLPGLAMDEIIHQVCAGNHNAIVLTSQGRVISLGHASSVGRYSAFAPDDDTEASENKPKVNQCVAPGFVTGFPQTVQRIGGGEGAFAVLLLDGSIYYWGAAQYCPVPVVSQGPPCTYHGLPIQVEVPANIINECGPVVDFAMGMRQMIFLHASGSITRATASVGDKAGEFAQLVIPEQVAQICLAGDHGLFVTTAGNVYGIGAASDGQLPQPTQASDAKEWQASFDKFDEAMESYRERVQAYRANILEHAKICPRSATATTDADDEEDIDNFYQAIGSFASVQTMQIGTVRGVFHSCGTCLEAPPPNMPHDLTFGPSLPPQREWLEGKPSGGKDMDEPGLCMVGPEYKRMSNKSDSLWAECPKVAWNAITGPYGCTPGSYAPVVAAVGDWGFSLFLHVTGELSVTGAGTSVCLGVSPPYAKDEDEENEEDDDDDDNEDNSREGGDGNDTGDVDMEDKNEELKDDDNKDSNEEDVEGGGIPQWGLCTAHTYLGQHTYIDCFASIGSPMAVTEHSLGRNGCAVATSMAGTVVVDSTTGRVHGCGTKMGQEEFSKLFKPLLYTQVA